MSKSNLAVNEEFEDIIEEEIIPNEKINQNIGSEQKSNIIYIILKKIVDVLSGIFGTILLIPITIIVCVIRICLHENDGPLFFEQIRIGKNGKQFRMYKFRTMVMEADEKLEKYLEENPEAKREYKKYKKSMARKIV
mgnify:FL=1